MPPALPAAAQHDEEIGVAALKGCLMIRHRVGVRVKDLCELKKIDEEVFRRVVAV